MRKVAVLIPCLNEEKTIRLVIEQFRSALPEATVYVFDNASTDHTAQRAKDAGASVIASPIRGKGTVVHHMFESIDADAYVLVDGDGTYPAQAARDMIGKLDQGAHMVVGARQAEAGTAAFRRFHRLGNRAISSLISLLFGTQVTDVLSGYRVLSREFVRTVPLKSSGFEIETELTLQALTKKFSLVEIPVSYGARPAGSFSKLSTFADGVLILKAIVVIFRDFRPLVFFGTIAILFSFLSLVAGVWPIIDYLQYHYVYRVPLAILAAGLGILSVVFFGIGLILNSVARYHLENFEVLRKQRR